MRGVLSWQWFLRGLILDVVFALASFTAAAGTCAPILTNANPVNLTSANLVNVSQPDAAQGEQLYINGDAVRGVMACVTCHGTGGRSTLAENPNLAAQPHEYLVKQLLDFQTKAGTSSPARHGAKGMPSVMTAMVANLSEADMQNIALYLSQQSLQTQQSLQSQQSPESQPSPQSQPSLQTPAITPHETMDVWGQKNQETQDELSKKNQKASDVLSQSNQKTPDGLGQQIWYGGVSARDVPACAACHGATGKGIPAHYPRLSGQFSAYIQEQLQQFQCGQRNNSEVMSTIARRMSQAEIKAVSDYAAGLR